MKITVIDQLGKVVFTRDEGIVSGFYKQEFNFSHLPTGIYMLHVESEGRSASLRLVRQ